ncbi:Leucine--tRNA ligase [Chlamydiales bacterium SCGC AB-751-O23]|jgi:leucyl-tRNA synthetase|nr:Leucine--tRNA ligase [Chlamydiales bacterium SCGC AB-751-O23]
MSKASYDFQKIEAKWQEHWLKNKIYKAEIDASRPKYYVLDMFPYPSGSGLHVGHVAGYTSTDIVARYKRQKGFSVMHPMGWDSFGLPAEQYAIRTGTHPAITTEKNINNFRSQLQKLGFSYDWDREVKTSDPDFYKWTQWIFTKLYEKGLAYEAEVLVNYCPKLGTVLANEEVVEGKSLEGGFPVERRPLRQWVLKITDYAEKLLDGLEDLDWPEGLKKLQRNWIGKSRGAKVHFTVDGINEQLTVFTTRPDTLFGATYMVVAPEHPILDQIVSKEQKSEIKDYLDLAKRKSDFQRSELNKDKTGVFTGGYAVNPINQEKIPIWVSDYVLMNYGTGAIMAVPAHDERDFEFATKFNLSIKAVLDPKENLKLAKERGYKDFESFRGDVVNGKIFFAGPSTLINSSNDEFSINEIESKQAIIDVCDYLLKKGCGEKTVNYKLRDWLFSRQRYWGEPFPILHLKDGSKRLLDIDELPLLPPEIEEYKPNEQGESPLAKVDDWINVNDKKTGQQAKRESNTMPQWAGSCWYYLRFCDPHNSENFCSKEAQKYWLPVDFYIGGSEHTVTHMLYARFWHKVLHDLGHLTSTEPFQRWRNPGMVTSRSFQKESGVYLEPTEVKEKEGSYFCKTSGEKLSSQIEKMSKSKLNGVSPDEVVKEFGADSLRLYEMFMGPLDKEKVWNTDAVSGCYRFLTRFYDLIFSEKVSEADTDEALKLSHGLVASVAKDIENYSFNTAIAKMMEFINNFVKLETYPRKALLMVVQCLFPFAPHIGEEAWEHLKGEGELSYTPFPQADSKYTSASEAVYVIQVNGKVRAKFELAKGLSKEVILKMAKEDPKVQKYLSDAEIKKAIFIPNKLLSLVVS